MPAILAVALVVILVVVGAVVISRRGASAEATPTARPSGQPITAPSSAASPPASSPPSVAASAAPSSAAASASAAASVAPRVRVVGNTDGDGVYLRRTPSMEDRDTAYPDGTELVVIGPDVTAEGELWHHVRTPDGKTGYVPAKYTVDPPQ